MSLDDRALGFVLGTLEEDEMENARKELDRDPAFAEAVARAEADVQTVRHGIDLLAEGAARPARPLLRPLVAAAAVLVLVAGAMTWAARSAPEAPPLADGGAGSGRAPGMNSSVPGLGELDTLAAGSVAIVTGTVTGVTTGSLGEADGAMQYAIATVAVDEAIKGAPGGTIAALDYLTDGAVTSAGGTDAPFPSEGDRVLLFLADSTGTAHEDVEPSPHFQMMHGSAGRYLIANGELVGASFTLEEVRAAVR